MASTVFCACWGSRSVAADVVYGIMFCYAHMTETNRQKSMIDSSTCPAVVEHGVPRKMEREGCAADLLVGFQNALSMFMYGTAVSHNP